MADGLQFAKLPTAEVDEEGNVTVTATLLDERDELWYDLALEVEGADAYQLGGAEGLVWLTVPQRAEENAGPQDIEGALQWLVSTIAVVDGLRREAKERQTTLQDQVDRQLARWWESYVQSGESRGRR